ncbi:MAG: hypothetical protein LBQ54_14125 [Planctomycetaceae bacterium]|jgi:hypothetical protein|nr:hypothetical protein [Planctomycetaceae bacterium]
MTPIITNPHKGRIAPVLSKKTVIQVLIIEMFAMKVWILLRILVIHALIDTLVIPVVPVR